MNLRYRCILEPEVQSRPQHSKFWCSQVQGACDDFLSQKSSRVEQVTVLSEGARWALSWLVWWVPHCSSRQRLLVMHDLCQVFAWFWLYYMILSHKLLFLGDLGRLKISVLESVFSILYIWWNLPWAGMRAEWLWQLCLPSGWGIADRLYHGSYDGGRGCGSRLLLLSAASLVNAHFSCQYFLISWSPTLVMTVSGVTDSDSIQVGFLPR